MMRRMRAWLALLLTGVALFGAGRCEDAAALGVAEVTTAKGTLNLRRQPAANASILERIPNHSLVRVLATGEAYWQIQYGAKIGYAACEYLTMTDLSPDVLDYRLLFRNNTGDDVLAVKQRLLALGYYREGANMNNVYNETCVERMRMFQRQNGLPEDGIASPAVQAALYASAAVANAEPLPKAASGGFVIASGTDGSGASNDIDWNQWMLDNPGICPCCMGKGCGCCNGTGHI